MQMGFWRKFSLSIFWLAHLFVWKYLPFFPFSEAGREGERPPGFSCGVVQARDLGWVSALTSHNRKPAERQTGESLLGSRHCGFYKNSGKDNRSIDKAIASQLQHQAFDEQETALERNHKLQQPRINTVVFISVPSVLVSVLVFWIVLHYLNAFSRWQNRAIRIQDLLYE